MARDRSLLRRIAERRRSGLILGKPDVRVDLPSHTRGVKQGNSRGNYAKQPGHLPDGRSTAARSTGIRPRARNPILPGMPNLSPP
ncbi:hypothetical protein SacglDRAFT_00872 [Saccharomonospora glauca K62]|jgi:hypothetical protein|uniref:Uncharacterized protein n=1 Tax=Saccharomonospora glauca K62 TaxID=928724 RepID=I1CYN6_9PSEU|nr:hypothetical protein SacglDRAFT_00872 [Saccharomonospora glauca K62]